MKKKAVLVAILLTGLTPVIGFCAEERSGEPSPLGLIFYVINFSIFVVVLWKYGAPYLRGFFSSRSTTIRSEMDRLKGAVEAAERELRAAQSKLAGIDLEIKALADEMRSEARHEVERVVKSAEAIAAQVRKDAMARAHAVADNARREWRRRLVHRAVEIARPMIRAEVGADDQNRLIDEFVEQIQVEPRNL